MKMKVADLTGATLDWAVAKARNAVFAIVHGRGAVYEKNGLWLPGQHGLIPYVLRSQFNYWWRECDYNDAFGNDVEVWEPSVAWAQGGPILAQKKMTVEFVPTIGWRAALEFLDEPQTEVTGCPTALVAIARCFVASEFGNEIDIPDELINKELT